MYFLYAYYVYKKFKINEYYIIYLELNVKENKHVCAPEIVLVLNSQFTVSKYHQNWLQSTSNRNSLNFWANT